MFVLHVEMKVKPESRQSLENTYLETFNPAIAKQDGFRGVDLLRAAEEGNDYRLSIAFQDQAAQQRWVATEIHQEVWPQMERQCVSYSVKSFQAVNG